MVQFKGSKPDNKIPQWLETIQENSWEAELLLSAVLLFGLIQTPIFLDTWTREFFAWNDGYLKTLLENINRGLEILRIGFIFHIIVRAMWIAQVGFSYVYPSGIKVDSLKFKGRFRKELSKVDSSVQSIMFLERLASTIFAVSFSLFGMLMGLVAYASPFLGFALLIENPDIHTAVKGILIFLMLSYLFLSFLVFIDFVTNGLLRRGRRRAKYFYHISWFFRIFTLSFLYRKTLLTIISNTKGYKKYVITIGLLLIVVFSDNLTDMVPDHYFDNYRENLKMGFTQNANYESKRSASDVMVATVQSDIIDNNVISLFIKDISLFGKFDWKEDEKDTSKIKFTTSLKDEVFNIKTENLNEVLNIYVDSVQCQELNWNSTVHPKTYDKGYIAYINLDTLPAKLYNLIIKVKEEEDDKPIEKDSTIAFIPFYLNK